MQWSDEAIRAANQAYWGADTIMRWEAMKRALDAALDAQGLDDIVEQRLAAERKVIVDNMESERIKYPEDAYDHLQNHMIDLLTNALSGKKS
jgi:hypothetical protein